MLWEKKTVEVVGAPAPREESRESGPYRGTVVCDPPTETSLARDMYDKAKAFQEDSAAREEQALVRSTIETTLPYALRKIDEYASVGVMESLIVYLIPGMGPHEYCRDTLTRELATRGLKVVSAAGDAPEDLRVSWDFSGEDD